MPRQSEAIELAASGLFDPEYYSEQLVKLGIQTSAPLQHFLDKGFRAGIRPNPYFDPAIYLTEHKDVARSALNPLTHYIRHGEREGRRPIAIFDPVWYRIAYRIPHNVLALSHFLKYWKQGVLLPCPEALVRAVLHGHNHQHVAESTAELRDMEVEYLQTTGLVDPNYYLLNGPDVLAADVEPTLHFCVWGWKENRKPNIYFDTDWYSLTNPEVGFLAVNPLAHYALVGERLGRRPTPWFDPVWYRRTYSVPYNETALGDYLRQRYRAERSPNRYFDARSYRVHAGLVAAEHMDLFAHYLNGAAAIEISPSSDFNPSEYRRRHLGRQSRAFRGFAKSEQANSLAHKLAKEYLERFAL